MDPDITILYGSQTGNAEDMAKRIGYKAKSLGYRVLVKTMDDFQLKLLPKQRFVLFVCSTTGHGQEPENMKNLYNFIRRRDLPQNCLSKLIFAVYGLGDSSYSKFNYVSKILFNRLKECGAKPLQYLVTGDEQHHLGCDGIIYPELDELWVKLELVLDCKVQPPAFKNALPENSYDFLPYNRSDSLLPKDVFEEGYIKRNQMKTAVCTVNRRVTDETHFQDTRFLCFRGLDELNYQPGDVCTILPANSDDTVDDLIKILNLDREKRVIVRKRDVNYMVNYLYDFIPDGLRVEDLVRYYLDIQSVPKRSFFEFLWPFSEDSLERDKLKEFASTEGQEEMYEYCIQPKRSILEVLLDFPNTLKNIKLEYILDMIPPIKPRSFSIASSAKLHPNEVHLIVGVVKYQTRLKKMRLGLCSNYLAALKPSEADSDEGCANNKLRFFIRRSDFKLPKDEETPMIMIGPGLGIAPFRSFIEERSINVKVCENNWLYFGCRYKEKDFYFREELEGYSNSGFLKLKVAFSRHEEKKYVQNLILDDQQIIRDLILHKGAVIYVAGNSKLPEDLRKLLVKIVTLKEGKEEVPLEPEKFVAHLESQNRIQYDCW